MIEPTLLPWVLALSTAAIGQPAPAMEEQLVVGRSSEVGVQAGLDSFFSSCEFSRPTGRQLCSNQTLGGEIGGQLRYQHLLTHANVRWVSAQSSAGGGVGVGGVAALGRWEFKAGGHLEVESVKGVHLGPGLWLGSRLVVPWRRVESTEGEEAEGPAHGLAVETDLRFLAVYWPDLGGAGLRKGGHLRVNLLTKGRRIGVGLHGPLGRLNYVEGYRASMHVGFEFE